MIEVRTKDKVFIAAVLPLVIAGLYLHAWRPAAVKKLNVLETRDHATVTEAAFPGEKLARQRMLSAAEAAVRAESAIPAPLPAVTGNAEDPPALRTENVLGVLRSSELRVVSSEVVKSAGGSRAAEALRATGIRPSPVCRAYRLKGAFTGVRAALEKFVDGKSPVVVSGAATGDGAEWRLEIYE